MTVACQDPPVRTSSTAVPGLAGSQPSKWLGWVRTCQTLPRGPFRVRVTVKSLIGISPVVGLAEPRPQIGAQSWRRRRTCFDRLPDRAVGRDQGTAAGRLAFNQFELGQHGVLGEEPLAAEGAGGDT